MSNSAEELVNSLKSLGEEGGAYASGLADQAATMGGKFSNLQDNLASFAKGIGEGGLNTALKEVLDTLNGLFEGSGQLATKIGAGLGAAILTLVDRFKLIVSTGKAIFGGLSDMVVDLLGNIKQNFANLPEMLSMGGVVQKFNSAFVTAGNIVKKITNFMINTFRAFYEQAFSIITKLPDIFSEVFQGIGRLAIDFGSRIVNQFRSIGKAMKMAIQAPFTDVTFADALMEASKNAFENFSLGDSFDMPD